MVSASRGCRIGTRSIRPYIKLDDSTCGIGPGCMGNGTEHYRASRSSQTCANISGLSHSVLNLHRQCDWEGSTYTIPRVFDRPPTNYDNSFRPIAIRVDLVEFPACSLRYRICMPYNFFYWFWNLLHASLRHKK